MPFASLRSRALLLLAVAAPLAAHAQGTWSSDQLLGLNVNASIDWDKTWIFRNLLLQARSWCPLTSPWTCDGNGVLLKQAGDPNEGYPSAGQSFNIVFATELTADNAGEYLISVAGNHPPINTGSGTLSTPVYQPGINRTTAILSIPAAPGPGALIALKWNAVGADFGDLKLMQPGYVPTDAERYTPAALAHYRRASSLRAMDWLRTNESMDQRYPGSIAANKNAPLGYRNSLKGFLDFSSATGSQPWVNVPTRASDAYLSGFVAELAKQLPVGQSGVVEFTNEPWNLGFPAWQILMNQALTNAKVSVGRAGATTGRVLSVQRSGGIVTVKLDREHGKQSGEQVVANADSSGAIPSGLVTLVDGSGGKVLKYAQSGPDVVGVVDTNWYASFVALMPTHELVAPLANYGPAGRYAEPGQVKTRYEMTRMRAIYEALAAKSLDKRVSVVKGVQLDNFWYELPALAWARERYGSLDWLGSGGLSPAYYMKPAVPANIHSVDDVFTGLDASRVQIARQLIKLRNATISLGQPTLRGYEAGPHNDEKVNETIAGYIRTAHRDDPRMIELLRAQYADWRNRGGGPLMYFHGGATASYGGLGNNTWALREGTLTSSGRNVKDEFFGAERDVSSQPVAVEGVTRGTISIPSVFPSQDGAGEYNGQLIVSPSTRLPCFGFLVTADSTRSHLIALDAGSSAGVNQDRVSLSVDGVALGTAFLPSVNVYTTKPGQALSAAVNLGVGQHVVRACLEPTRQGAIGLYQLRVN